MADRGPRCLSGPDRSATFVTTPDGERLEIADPALAAALRIGGLQMRVDRRDGCVGVYGATVEPGRVAVGDPVTIAAAGS